MRYLILMFLLITNFLVFGQSKKELRSNIYDLNNKYDELNENYIKLDKKYNALKEKHSVSYDTPENYAKSLFKFLKSKNKNEASKLLISVDDSNLFSTKLNQVIKEEADEDSISVSDWIQAQNDGSKKNF
jgi:poly-beta-hydroxyalkanoate depolymerase